MRAFAIAMLLVAGCDGATQAVTDGSVDAIYETTPPFAPVLCTSGNPGEPTCPETVIDLSSVVSGARLEMIVQPLATGFYMRDITLTPGPTGLYLERLTFVEVRASGEVVPLFSPFPPVINLDDEPLVIASAAFMIPTTSKLALQYDVAGPYRP